MCRWFVGKGRGGSGRCVDGLWVGEEGVVRDI